MTADNQNKVVTAAPRTPTKILFNTFAKPLALEINFLKLYQWTVEGDDITKQEKAHLERIAREIRNGHGYVDDTEPHLVDAVKAALVVPGALTDVEHDKDDQE